MNKISFILLILISIGFVSCETDIDVNAEPTDITVVYGLIDPNDTTHYIKINKAFLGEGNALDLAGNASNYDYADGDLLITINEMSSGGTVLKTFSTGAGTVVRTTNEIIKEAGVFDNSTNVLYKFIEPTIDRNSTYELQIVNTTLNKEVTTKTNIVGTTVVSVPKQNASFKFWNGTTFLSEPFSVGIGRDAGRAQTFFIFRYIEHYTLASGKAPVAKKVVINLGEEIASTSLGGDELNFSLKGETFFDNIASSVSDPSTVSDFSHRELDNASIEVLSAGTELSTFMEANAPSSTVNQDKPEYTNIDNGVGIFSSRDRYYWVSSRLTANGDLNLNSETRSELKKLNLGFCFGTSPTGAAPCNQL